MRKATAPVRVIEDDYDYGYDPRWHSDLDDLRGVHLDRPWQALLVVADDTTGGIVGTVTVRMLVIASPPHPARGRCGLRPRAKRRAGASLH